MSAIKKPNIPVVAIIGRTNVGKSTLFNLITGKRISIVNDSPGVTRDRHYALVNKENFPFTLIDTGGLYGEEGLELVESVRLQAQLAIEEADAIICLFDGLHGLHPQDHEIAELLRVVNKPIFPVVNKCEKQKTELAASEIYALGFEKIWTISAAHNMGVPKLLADVKNTLAETFTLENQTAEDTAIYTAFLGKPNVGKSTLTNKLLGEERVISSAKAGTTRDSVNVRLTRDGQEFVMVDTAGLRKKAKIDANTVERYSALRTLRALAQCDVAVLIIDAEQGPPTEQDTKIAGLVHERGIPLVIVVNKWDAVEKDHKTAKEYKLAVYDQFKFAKYSPIIFVSALTGKRCPNVLRKVKEVHEASKVRIKTSDINRVLLQAIAKKPPPVYRGEPIKLYFTTQVGESPPTFILFFNHPRKINFSYQRFLKNEIRRHFPFEGSNIKLIMKKRTSKFDKTQEEEKAKVV
ncbi:MAG: ribosome biogenesis GTPase Der [Bdellovibrionota bacterium]